MDADTGLGNIPGTGLAFTRQSFVGLSGGWGRVDLGRMYTPIFYSILAGDAFGINGIFSFMTLLGATDGQTGIGPFGYRANNVIRYRSNAAGPFLLDLMWAPGEAIASSQKSGDTLGGNVGWRSGPLYVSYGFQQVWSGSAAAPVAVPTKSTYQSISASYQITQSFKLFGNYARTKASLATVPTATLVNLSANYSSGAGVTSLALAKREVSGSPRGQSGILLGYDHSLSKRTALYARAGKLTNKDKASATWARVAPLANSGEDLSTYAVGVRHSF